MLFNSFAYLLFFPLVCIAYYLIPHKYRWLFLLIASYYFYMNWQPIYALLILTSTVVTYWVANQLYRTQDKRARKLFLTIGLVINFGILFLFKYYNLFNDSVFEVMNLMGIRMKLPSFDLLLPVGISFYTFQAVGYMIDIFRGGIKPEKHFGKYALFVSFFPQLVAGPIERASSLLPQFNEKKVFEYHRGMEGLKLIVWGYFMKVVVADRLAIYVNVVYNNHDAHGSMTLLVATFFFAVQIYCDFAGYSNIAIGSAKIMGFDLMTNFRRPHFASSPAEFWRRWHISLSTWFKDYVYIPLGGNRSGKVRNNINLFATFLISGLWHGANWTFVLWGAVNGLYLIIYRFLGINIKNTNSKNLLRFRNILNIIITFWLLSFSRIFFRANGFTSALDIIRRIFTVSGEFFIGDIGSFVYSLIGILILFIKDLIDEKNIDLLSIQSRPFQFLRYSLIVIIIILIGVFDGGQFIYFQF